MCQTRLDSSALHSACADVVRKLIYGDVDLGIVGLDMLAEIGHDDPGGWQRVVAVRCFTRSYQALAEHP